MILTQLKGICYDDIYVTNSFFIIERRFALYYLWKGGDISSIANEEVYSFIRLVVNNGNLVAGICSGVDELENAGILKEIESTHSVKADLVVGDYVITARANMYVDMAIAIGKKMNLFADEADLQEIIDFWKLHKSFY